MAKPAITKRLVKGAALTYAEQDQNFQNLADATITLTAGTGGQTVTADLNGNITLVAGTGITLTGNDTAKTVTITSTGGLQNVEEDTSPTLGGSLDLAGYSITNTGTSEINLVGSSGSTVIRGNASIVIQPTGYGSKIGVLNNQVTIQANTGSNGKIMIYDGFSGTSTPTNTSTIVKWIKVFVEGSATEYWLPLYQ